MVSLLNAGRTNYKVFFVIRKTKESSFTVDLPFLSPWPGHRRDSIGTWTIPKKSAVMNRSRVRDRYRSSPRSRGHFCVLFKRSRHWSGHWSIENDANSCYNCFKHWNRWRPMQINVINNLYLVRSVSRSLSR